MKNEFEQICRQVMEHPEYRANIAWGTARPGHPEGSVRAHIEELEENLAAMQARQPLPEEEAWKLRLLIHVHDTFKATAHEGVRITDPNSHASLARRFLERFCSDSDLLNMVQFHDEPYALWLQQIRKGRHDAARLQALLDLIRDWPLFLRFLAIDGITIGKSPEPLFWFFGQVCGLVPGADKGLIEGLIHAKDRTV